LAEIKPENEITQQLALPLRLMAGATFDNYFGVNNARPAAILRDMLTQRQEMFAYVYGAEGTGKSHLLCAACQYVGMDARVCYVPIDAFLHNLIDSFHGLETFDLVCLDDIDCIIGEREKELALFNLFNRIKDAGHQLIVSATKPPSGFEFVLPDLASRMGWGIVLALQGLDDQEKAEALKKRALETGVELPDEVISFIMKRSKRTLRELFELFEQLDEASYKLQRRITVPFAKDVLGW